MKSTKQSVLCYDGITRKGKVVYIHEVKNGAK